jgi:hypothetical protein
VCRLGREAEDKPGEPRGPGGMPRWVHSSEGLGRIVWAMPNLGEKLFKSCTLLLGH